MSLYRSWQATEERLFESIDGGLWDELLKQECFDSLDEADKKVERARSD